MSTRAEERTKRLAGTKDAARALVEDLEHMRDVVDQQGESAAAIRRISVLLRRILFEDLGPVARPRIGRFTLTAPDNRSVYNHKFSPPALFVSGRVRVFGWYGSYDHWLVPNKRNVKLSAPDPAALNNTVSYNLGKFNSQHVLAIDRQWISRRAAILYVANKGSGAHSGDLETHEHDLIHHLRTRNRFLFDKPGKMTVQVNRSPQSSDNEEFEWSDKAIDPVLIEVLASAKFLVDSPDIQRLEEVIRNEQLSEPLPSDN